MLGRFSSHTMTCRIAAKAVAVEAAVDDVVLVETGDVEASAGPALQSMDDLEIRAEDIPTDEDLDKDPGPLLCCGQGAL